MQFCNNTSKYRYTQPEGTSIKPSRKKTIIVNNGKIKGMVYDYKGYGEITSLM